MKTSNKLYMILSLVFVIIFTAQSAVAGCAIRGDGRDPLDSDPQAKGTKYTGPLIVYYDDNDTTSITSDDQICWFVRLKKGADLYTFTECSDQAWDTIDVDFRGSDSLEPRNFQIDARDLLKEYFFQRVVVPEIYSECELDIDCPTAELKSYEDIVGSDEWTPPPGVYEYWMMNITVAVQD